jgi:hypothetical protein
VDKKWVLRVIAGICIVGFLGYIYFYETTLHGLLNTTKVVLAKETIPKNTRITQEHLYITDFPKKLVTPKTIINKDLLIGKRTGSVINQNDTFTLDKVDDARLRVSDEHRFFSIPSRWIESVPGSLRRLDLVDVWLIPTGNEGFKLSMDTPLLEKKVVAFIKNKQNKEVVGNENPSNRLNAKSSPAVLELSLTNREFSLMKEAVQKGFKLVFSY